MTAHKNIASLILKYARFMIVFKRDNHVNNTFFVNHLKMFPHKKQIAKIIYSLHLNNTYMNA